MESHYNIEKHDTFIRLTYQKGSLINDQSVMVAIADLNESFDMALWNALWDFRGCVPNESFSYKEINKIINYIEKEERIQWSPKVALLVDSDLQYGLSRMFQIVASERPSQIEVFKAAQDALKWITH